MNFDRVINLDRIALFGQSGSGKSTLVGRAAHSNLLQESDDQAYNRHAYEFKENDQKYVFEVIDFNGASEEKCRMGPIAEIFENERISLFILVLRAGRMESQLRRVLKKNLGYFHLTSANTRVFLTHIKHEEIMRWLNAEVRGVSNRDAIFRDILEIDDPINVRIDGCDLTTEQPIATNIMRQWITQVAPGDRVELKGCVVA